MHRSLTYLILVSWFGDLSVENVSELNRIHIHAPCVNWSTGIYYPHSEHAHRLAHFRRGLHIVTAEKGKATKMSY
jgi:hypothetical protein